MLSMTGLSLKSSLSSFQGLCTQQVRFTGGDTTTNQEDKYTPSSNESSRKAKHRSQAYDQLVGKSSTKPDPSKFDLARIIHTTRIECV